MTDSLRCARCRAGNQLLLRGSIMGVLCTYCLPKWTSLAAHLGIANHAPITIEQRTWAWRWFLKTDYFSRHRRMSRGRARKLLEAMP